MGWFHTPHIETTQTPEQIAAERAFALRYLGTNGREIHWDLIRIALASVADTVIIPLQGHPRPRQLRTHEHPWNRQGNWSWRFQSGQLDPRVLLAWPT